ncbi:hypothetical protein LEP1GSC018_2301 [Leptospira kirschneri str. 2008720114]|nr:hypothetical protein LEP1GSC018_2301 [Leptospira kirschneri str. 2008720114]
MTEAKEPGPAACGKPDSPWFFYVELSYFKFLVFLNFVFRKVV